MFKKENKEEISISVDPLNVTVDLCFNYKKFVKFGLEHLDELKNSYPVYFDRTEDADLSESEKITCFLSRVFSHRIFDSYDRSIGLIIADSEENFPQKDDIIESLWKTGLEKFPEISEKNKRILEKKVYKDRFFLENSKKIQGKELLDRYSNLFLDSIASIAFPDDKKRIFKNSFQYPSPKIEYKNILQEKVNDLFEETLEKQKASEQRKQNDQKKNDILKKEREGRKPLIPDQHIRKQKEDIPREVSDFCRDVIRYFSKILGVKNERPIRRFLLNQNSKHSFDDIINRLESEYDVEIEITDELKTLMSRAKKLGLSEKKVLEEIADQLENGEEKSVNLDSSSDGDVNQAQENDVNCEFSPYLEADDIPVNVWVSLLQEKGFTLKSDSICADFNGLRSISKKRLFRHILWDKERCFSLAKGGGDKFYTWDFDKSFGGMRLVANQDREIVGLPKDHDDYERLLKNMRSSKLVY